jgi:hypothetical protein
VARATIGGAKPDVTGSELPGFATSASVPYFGMTDLEKKPDATAERRVDTKTREVVELVLIELRRQGIIEKEIEAFLVRRRNRAERSLIPKGRRPPWRQP